MDIGVSMVISSESMDVADLAQRAEALGFESFWLPEHPVIPVTTTSKYGGQRGVLVRFHQARIAGDVSGEDGGQPTFRTFRFHRNIPSGWPAHQGWFQWLVYTSSGLSEAAICPEPLCSGGEIGRFSALRQMSAYGY